MIGTTFTEGDAVYTVVAADGGHWIVNRVDSFDGPRRMTSAEIAERFSVEATDPAQPSERAGWEALADANDRGARRLAYATSPEDFEPEPETAEHDAWQQRVRAAKTNSERSPEEEFRRVSDADARRLGHKS